MKGWLRAGGGGGGRDDRILRHGGSHSDFAHAMPQRKHMQHPQLLPFAQLPQDLFFQP
jgi:hypothetical protein